MNSSAASSFAAVMGSAVRSTRWMRMSSAVCSEKPMAFFSSSPSSRSILPSCCTSSTNSSSSSWDILLLAVQPEHAAQQFLPQGEHRVQRRQHPDEHLQNGCRQRGAFLRAVLGDALGEISPKISTTTVTTTVEMVAPASP